MVQLDSTWIIDVVGHNQFSFVVPRAEWIDPEWLYQIFLWLIYRLAGEYGVVVFQLLGACVPASLLYQLNVRQHGNGVLAIAGLIVPLFGIRFGLRPQIVTYVGVALVYSLCLSGWDKGLGRLIVLPVFFLIWANMPGGFVAGLVIFGSLIPYLFWCGPPDRRTEGWWIAGILLASVAVTPVNPYGIRLWRLVIEASTHTFTRQFIVDWRPLISRPWLFVLGVLLTVQAVVWLWFRQTLSAVLKLFPVPITAVIAFVSLRNLPLLAISVACICVIPADPTGERGPVSVSAIGHILLVAVIVVRGCGGLIVPDRFRPNKLSGPLINRSGEKKVFAHYNWPQWLLFEEPGTRVYFDTRYDTAYPRSVIDRYVKIVNGSVRLLDRSGAEWVLSVHWYSLNGCLSRSDHWRLIRETDRGQLWKRYSHGK